MYLEKINIIPQGMSSTLSNHLSDSALCINRDSVLSVENSSAYFVSIKDPVDELESDYMDIHDIIKISQSEKVRHHARGVISLCDEKCILEKYDYLFEEKIKIEEKRKKMKEVLSNRKINDINLIKFNNNNLSIEMRNNSILPFVFVRNEEGQYIRYNEEKNAALLSMCKISSENNRLKIEFESKLNKKIVPSVIVEDMIDELEYFKLIREYNNSDFMSNVKNITLRVPELIISLKENDKGEVVLFLDKDINKENNKYLNKLDNVLSLKKSNLTIEITGDDDLFPESHELLMRNENLLIENGELLIKDDGSLRFLEDLLAKSNKSLIEDSNINEVNEKLFIIDKVCKFINNNYIFINSYKKEFKDNLLKEIQNETLYNLIMKDNETGDISSSLLIKIVKKHLKTYNSKENVNKVTLSKDNIEAIFKKFYSIELPNNKSEYSNFIDDLDIKADIADNIANLLIKSIDTKFLLKDQLMVEFNKHTLSGLFSINKGSSHYRISDIIVDSYNNRLDKMTMKKIKDKELINNIVKGFRM